MVNKEKFLTYLDKIKQICLNNDIDISPVQSLQHQISNKELIIPVVGGFSVGKSTLINSFLGNSILSTNVTPETALPTELRYSENERIDAIKVDGSVVPFDIKNLSSFNRDAKNYSSLKLYLNNENLKKIEPLVLVDMPGFDAPIDAHNQAILNYLNIGVFFVFLSSIEDGNLTMSMKREIDNLQLVDKDFAFCISKTNLRPPSDVVKVQERIIGQLNEYYFYDKPVVCLDMDGGKNLETILNSINPEQLFYSLFIDELRDNYSNIEESINLRISTFKGTKQEAEDSIRALKESLKEIIEKKNKAIEDVENRYSRRSTNSIIENVVTAIMNHEASLVDMAISNSSMFSRELNEITKTTLISAIQERFNNISQDVIKDLGTVFSANIEGLISSSIGENLTNSLTKHSRTLATTMNVQLQQVGTQVISRIASTTLRSLAGAVLGIVGTIILFLPEIFTLFSAGAAERRQKESVRQKLAMEIIPQIRSQLSLELPNLMKDQIIKLIENISEQFENTLTQKKGEIEKAETEKAKNISMIEQEILKLETSKNELIQIANQYLFSES